MSRRWRACSRVRGWECWGFDLTDPPEIPENCNFENVDILSMSSNVNSPMWVGDFMPGLPDFIVASSPCESFSVHGMPHFFPNPAYPTMGIQLFSHTRALCESFGVPYVMENVKSAQRFVGRAEHHCGPFYLWGTGVPPLMPQNIKKNQRGSGSVITKTVLALPLEERRKKRNELNSAWPSSKKECARLAAIIPPELANCVADYAEALLEQRCKSR